MLEDVGDKTENYKGYIHRWVEFALVSGQTCLSRYMFNRGEISPLPLFRPFLEDRGETHLVGYSA